MIVGFDEGMPRFLFAGTPSTRDIGRETAYLRQAFLE